MTFAAGGAVSAVMLLAGAAAAQQPPKCEGEIPSVQREVSEAPLSSAKETQVKALLDQVVRACKEKNDVVALAGIDQVRAILIAEQKSGSGG
jgi:hypothetical protein